MAARVTGGAEVAAEVVAVPELARVLLFHLGGAAPAPEVLLCHGMEQPDDNRRMRYAQKNRTYKMMHSLLLLAMELHDELRPQRGPLVRASLL